MMKDLEEVIYTPLLKDSEGNVSLTEADYKRRGYLRYWGQTTSVRYFPSGEQYIPIGMTSVIAVVQDKENGNIDIALPQSIKVIARRTNKGDRPREQVQ